MFARTHYRRFMSAAITHKNSALAGALLSIGYKPTKAQRTQVEKKKNKAIASAFAKYDKMVIF